MIGESEEVLINSRDRISGDDNEFNYLIKLQRKYTHVICTQISIPKSYYLLDGETFTLREGITDYTITPPSGLYNRVGFASEIADLLNTAGAWTYSISINNSSVGEDDGKFLFTVSGNTSQPSFIFGDSQEISGSMGFNVNSTNVFVGDSLTSTNVINMNTEENIILRSDLVQDNVIARIFTGETDNFSVSTWQNMSPEFTKKKLLASQMTYNANFYLTDESNPPQRLHSLNGHNLSFVLVFFNIYDPFKQIIKLLNESLKELIKKE